MNKIAIAICSVLTLGLASCDEGPRERDSDDERFFGAQCEGPMEVVLDTLECIENGYPLCSARGYSSDFVKLHNTIDTDTDVPGAVFWFGAFLFADFAFDIDHVALVDVDQVSIRYIETVNLAGQEYVQHEHALVTVDDNCRMVLWDQYGDDAEQAEVDDAIAELLPG